MRPSRIRSLAIAAAILFAPALAGAEIGVAAGASYEAGNTPISPVLPQVMVEAIYRVAPWQVFGLDFVAATAPIQGAGYTKQGLSAGPELFLGVDASYRFPAVGPAEFAALIGGCVFQDYENRVNGSAAHAGVGVTFHIGKFFIQGRGLYRFVSSTGPSGQPIPVGAFSVALLAGYTITSVPF